MELSGSLLPNYVSFYSCVYYYQSCEHDGGPRYGSGWRSKCDGLECKEGEMCGSLNDSPSVSVD